MEFDLQLLKTYLQRPAELKLSDNLSDNYTLLSNLPAFEIHLVDTLPSTNQYLWELLDREAPAGTVVIGLQQQAGRGQWGRQWHSPRGGLYLSFALAPNLAVENSGQLTLMSAWGIATALRTYDIPVQLKWPNDLLIGKHKLGGILTETRSHQGYIHKAVLGIGINWANATPAGGINLQTVMAQTHSSAIASLEHLAAIVLQGVWVAYDYWQQEGMEKLLPSYQELLMHASGPVKINDDFGEITGVTSAGDLQVRLLNSEAPLAASTILLKPGMVSLGYDIETK
jgi:BirA family biotin operon repressor/biotin-[acetyl-CoA-carboxylase] ligase